MARLGFLVALVAAFISLVVMLFSLYVIKGMGPLDKSTTIVISPGTGLGSISLLLEDATIIRSATLFSIYARLAGLSGQLKAGEYRFATGISGERVINKLINHDVVLRSITVPEGLTSVQIIELLSREQGLSGDIQVDIPEGTLLPETYNYELSESRMVLVERMKRSLTHKLSNLINAGLITGPLGTMEQVIILASIVEKETSQPHERARIAAVFLNRLKAGMRLQSDPTVIYGLDPTGNFRSPILRSHLADTHPYNTYRIRGLPPGPICHPGIKSILAVLSPELTDELYFVADGSGGHAFSRNLAEHNRNVRFWRQQKIKK